MKHDLRGFRGSLDVALAEYWTGICKNDSTFGTKLMSAQLTQEHVDAMRAFLIRVGPHKKDYFHMALTFSIGHDHYLHGRVEHHQLEWSNTRQAANRFAGGQNKWIAGLGVRSDYQESDASD